jgi:CubicO group peptidase (beta-lactamase class C family)
MGKSEEWSGFFRKKRKHSLLVLRDKFLFKIREYLSILCREKNMLNDFKKKGFLFLSFFLIPGVFLAEDVQSRRVDQVFAKWGRSDSPGCSVGIIQNGEFLYKRGYGMANLEYNIPNSAETVFRIGSTSKQFTAMCIALLEEEGKLSFDDDIRKYLPEFPQYQNPVTIRHLLHHTSGIRDYLTLWGIAGVREDDFFVDGEVVDLLVRQRELNFTPGHEYLYSNSGYFLLSQIIKQASGKSMRIYARDKIFRPLGMKNTHFHDNHRRIVPRRASGYSPAGKDRFRISMTTLGMIGDGGVFTSVDDLLLWDRNFYNNILGRGGPQLMETMLSRGKLNSGKFLEYALGLIVEEYKGLKMVSHGGAFVGYRAEMIRFPEQRFSVIVLANLSSINPGRLARKVADIYLEGAYTQKETGIPAVEPLYIKLSEEQLKSLAGSFLHPKTGAVWTISAEIGGLQVNASGFRFRISPVDESRFNAENFPYPLEVRFTREKNKRILLVHEGDQEPVKCSQVQLLHPSPAQLKEYEGGYFSQELQVAYRIEQKKGKIFLRHENPYKDSPRLPLSPTLKDRFFVSRMRLKFIRNDEGRITSFLVNAGRVKNIRFRKK